MVEQRPCIICYRLTSDAVGLEQPRYEGKKQALTRFFHFLGRHLADGDDSKIDGTVEDAMFPFERISHADILACTDCWIVIESFCELYHRMKSIELLLNWKVKTLHNMMLCAQRVPTRVREFRCSTKKVDFGDFTSDEIFDFKEDIVKQCCRRLEKSQPRLILKKYTPGQYESKTVAEDDTNLTSVKSSPININDWDDEDAEPLTHVTSTNQVTCSLKGDLNLNSTKLAKEIVPTTIDMADVDAGNTLRDRANEDKDHQNTQLCMGTVGVDYETTNETKVNMPHLNPKKTCYFCNANFVHRSTLRTHKLICPKRPSTDPASFAKANSDLAEVTDMNTPADMFTMREAHPVASPSRQLSRDECNSTNIIPPNHHRSTNGVDKAHKTRSQIFRCSTCLKVLTSRKNLTKHFRTVHLQIRKFECDLCELKFKRKDHLNRHGRGVHGKG